MITCLFFKKLKLTKCGDKSANTIMTHKRFICKHQGTNHAFFGFSNSSCLNITIRIPSHWKNKNYSITHTHNPPNLNIYYLNLLWMRGGILFWGLLTHSDRGGLILSLNCQKNLLTCHVFITSFHTRTAIIVQRITKFISQTSRKKTQ